MSINELETSSPSQTERIFKQKFTNTSEEKEICRLWIQSLTLPLGYCERCSAVQKEVIIFDKAYEYWLIQFDLKSHSFVPAIVLIVVRCGMGHCANAWNAFNETHACIQKEVDELIRWEFLPRLTFVSPANRQQFVRLVNGNSVSTFQHGVNPSNTIYTLRLNHLNTTAKQVEARRTKQQTQYLYKYNTQLT